MPVITLTSDYGTIDHRVPAVKGKILSLKNDAKIVDITHDIQAYNLLQTAYIVRNAYPFFPLGSTHIISVDTFYRKERKLLVVKADGHYFVTADNGLISLMLYDKNPEAVFEITLNNRFDDEVNFTSTDVFVPVAVHLHNGGVPEVIGREISEIREVSFPRSVYNEGERMMIGEVMYIDNFGNVVTNISRKFFEKTFSGFESFELKFRNITLKNIYRQYTDVVTDWEREPEFHGKAAAIFNDVDLLELTIYKGSLHSGAKTLFGMHLGEKIYVEFT